MCVRCGSVLGHRVTTGRAFCVPVTDPCSHLGLAGDEHMFVHFVHMERVAAHDLERLKRSAAMLAPGQTMPIERSQLYSVLVELLELRALVTRLGADMTTAAKIARGHQ